MPIQAINSDQPHSDFRDPDVFSELVREHHRELLVYALSLTRDSNNAREIVQDAFIVAYDKIDTFDVTRDFATWMRGIVRNKWREWLRRNSRPEIPEDDLAMMDAAVAEWQDYRINRDNTVFDVLEQCVQRLPDTLREAVDACYYRGETGDEAAVSLGSAPAAIRKRLQRARDLLRDCVEKKMNLTSQNTGQSAITEEDDLPSS